MARVSSLTGTRTSLSIPPALYPPLSAVDDERHRAIEPGATYSIESSIRAEAESFLTLTRPDEVD